jgi:large subunit ribosomal protein L35
VYLPKNCEDSAVSGAEVEKILSAASGRQSVELRANFAGRAMAGHAASTGAFWSVGWTNFEKSAYNARLCVNCNIKRDITSGSQVLQARGLLAATCQLQIPKSVVMPKMKTKRGAAKRFIVRGSGSIKRGQAFKRHILTKKTTKNKRHLRGAVEVHASDVASVKAMMPFA